MRIATNTISGLYDGATTSKLDRLSIQTAAAYIAEEPSYAKLAARCLATYIDKEVLNQDIQSFSQSILAGQRLGLVNDRLATFLVAHARKLNDAIDPKRDHEVEYFGLRTVSTDISTSIRRSDSSSSRRSNYSFVLPARSRTRRATRSSSTIASPLSRTSRAPPPSSMRARGTSNYRAISCSNPPATTSQRSIKLLQM